MNFRICYTLALSLTTYIKLGSDIVDTLAMSQAAPGRAEAILNVPSSQYPFYQATYLRPWHSLYCVWPPAPACLPSTDATWHHCTRLLRVYRLPDATWHHCTRLAAKLYWLLLRLSYITEPWLVTELQQTGFIFTNKPVFSARPFPKGTVPFGGSNCLPQKRQCALWGL